jgi:ubiquinone/menaquinone biosynthesis C-methylase UbiE
MRVFHDIPVGTGRVIEYLSQMNISVVPCHISVKMLEIAERKSKEYCVQATLMIADARSLLFPDGSIECISCLRFFHLCGQCVRLGFMRRFAEC